jgi:hypothetical protein
MTDRPDPHSNELLAANQALVSPVEDSSHETLAKVLASPKAISLIGGLTEQFRSLGILPPRYQQELESCVAGKGSPSKAHRARHLLFSVAHQTSMEMLVAEGRKRFDRSKDVAEISGVALLERDGARGGGTDRLWHLLQQLGGTSAVLCEERDLVGHLEIRHAKALNWTPFEAESAEAGVLTAACFRIRYAGIRRQEVNQLLADAMADLSDLNRAERLSLHRCHHA